MYFLSFEVARDRDGDLADEQARYLAGYDWFKAVLGQQLRS